MKFVTKGFKKILNIKIGQARQKGSILVEFVVALPVLFVMIWGILNLMTYLLSSSHLNEAAYNIARSISKELRGYEGTNLDANVDMNRLEKELTLIIRQNSFLAYDLNSEQEPVKAYDKATCNAYFSAKNGLMNEHKNIFCAYIEPYDIGSGKNHHKIVVRLRSGFQMIGGAVKNMEDIVQVNGKSTAPQELPDRLNYYSY